MNDTASGALRRPVEHAWVENALARYPDTTPQELAELLTWFTSTASALDVATLASSPRVQQQYQHFRADHLDRLNASDLARAGLWLALATVAIAAFVFFALR